MTTKQFAIIGCEHAHIEIFIREMLSLGYTCAGVYEPGNPQLARSVSEKYGFPVVSDRERLLGDNVEIVGCASINNEKIDIIELCEARGKHIMVDKPAVTNNRGLQRLRAVMERGNIQVGMLLTERFHPAIYTLKKQIDQGMLGDIVSIGMRKPHRLNAANRPAWFFSKEQSGGILIDLLVHDFDLLRWLTGREIEMVEGFVGKTIFPEHPTFYNVTSLQVMMSGCIVSQLYADWHTPDESWTWGDGRIFVSGTKGAAELRLEGDPFVRKEALMLQLTHTEPAASVPLVKPPVTITEDFIRRVRGQSSAITHEDIWKTTEMTIRADSEMKFFDTTIGRGSQ